MLLSPSGGSGGVAPAENGASHGQVNRLLIEMSILANILLNTYSKIVK
jgi:hypothetical protein